MRPWYAFSRSLAESLLRVATPYQVIGQEHLPADSNFILAANHFHFIDPPLLAVACDRELHFIAKQEIFRVPGLGQLVTSLNAIPVRRGRFDRDALDRALAVLKAKQNLLIFPEGGRKRGYSQYPRAGIGYLAVQSGVPIIPAYINNSDRIGEAFRRRCQVTVVFGAPITIADCPFPITERDAYRRVADHVMQRVYHLSAQVA